MWNTYKNDKCMGCEYLIRHTYADPRSSSGLFTEYKCSYRQRCDRTAAVECITENFICPMPVTDDRPVPVDSNAGLIEAINNLTMEVKRQNDILASIIDQYDPKVIHVSVR